MIVQCKQCNKKFEKNKSEIKKTKNNFCSRSCSAKYNNKKHPKRTVEGNCKSCKRPIPSKRTYCDECNIFNIDFTKLTYGEVRGKRKYQKNSSIRQWARKLYLKSDKIQKCLKCGYEKHFDICHIKPISSFEDETPISVINDLNNLISLCKNHHWELDNGYLTIEEIFWQVGRDSNSQLQV